MVATPCLTLRWKVPERENNSFPLEGIIAQEIDNNVTSEVPTRCLAFKESGYVYMRMTLGVNVDDHFRDLTKMVQLGSSSQREI